MTNDERMKFLQDNSVRISHRENRWWSVEIPHGTWISRATLVETIDALYHEVTFTPEQHLALMNKVRVEEVELKAEHRRLYDRRLTDKPTTPEGDRNGK